VGRGSSHARRDGRTPRLALVGIIFGSVVLHELGHALVARGSGIPAKGIILLPIGGITISTSAAIPDPITLEARHSRRGRRPLVNLFIAGLSALILLSVMPNVSLTAKPLLHSSALLRSIVWANLLLGLFNCCRRSHGMAAAYCAQFFRGATTWFGATHRAVRIGTFFPF